MDATSNRAQYRFTINRRWCNENDRNKTYESQSSDIFSHTARRNLHDPAAPRLRTARDRSNLVRPQSRRSGRAFRSARGRHSVDATANRLRRFPSNDEVSSTHSNRHEVAVEKGATGPKPTQRRPPHNRNAHRREPAAFTSSSRPRCQLQDPLVAASSSVLAVYDSLLIFSSQNPGANGHRRDWQAMQESNSIGVVRRRPSPKGKPSELPQIYSRRDVRSPDHPIASPSLSSIPIFDNR